MFEIRLKMLLGCLTVAFGILVIRLVDLQVVSAEHYKQRAAAALLLEPKVLPFVRGRILDRSGRLLASDEPTWDVRVDYGLLANDRAYVERMVRRLRRTTRYGEDLTDDEITAAFRDEVEAMWSDLVRLGGVSLEEIDRRVAEIVERVQRVRAAVARSRGFDAAVAEERLRHAVLSGLDDQTQVAARRILGHYPWLRVEDSSRRVYHDATPLGHVLGHLGPVTPEVIRKSRRTSGDDPLARYEPNETVGVAGVEAAAEAILRGRRGRVRENREGWIIENVAPENGSDVTLTLRYDLQSRLYDVLGTALKDHPDAPGGVVVVLDIASRDVLAMVSYPAYDPNRFREDYARLRADTRRLPLRFRAVANSYQPGSIVKPLTCLAGLCGGRITQGTTFACTGSLFPDVPDRWRCWPIPGTSRRKAHGTIRVVEAIEGSCNVFLFHVGQSVGVEYLTSFFDMFGFGKFAGTGLPEEVRGINPTVDWIVTHRHRAVTPGDGRNFAVGQGELSVTPIQAANMMAVYASGVYKPVTLIRRLGQDTAEWKLPGHPDHWRAIREGLYRVVNDPSGTAYRHARFEESGWVICGKTGSAQTKPWAVSYRVPYVDANGDESVAFIPAGSLRQAVADLRRTQPDAAFDPERVRVHERWPPRGVGHAHAWFAGFLQRMDPDAHREPIWTETPRIAFVVLVEFGGSGGRTSGPIARQVAQAVLEILGPELDADAPPARTGWKAGPTRGGR